MSTVKYIKKSKLDWPNLWCDFGMSKDKGGRWYHTSETPEWVQDFLSEYRTPSRAWPNSYATAMLTQKFAKLVVEHDPKLAVKIGIAN